MVSRDADIVRRHRNPLGIYSRALVYPLMGVGVWRHRLGVVVAGAVFEGLLWTAMPPVEKTHQAVEDAIEMELRWLNAPAGPQKNVSFALLALFPLVLLTGLWRHSTRVIATAVGILAAFHALMRRIGGSAARSAA